MTETMERCPECGAEWSDGMTCIDHFYLMGAWKFDYQRYEVHHLMVLSYYLQHPSLYSPEGLAGAKQLLAEFLLAGHPAARDAPTYWQKRRFKRARLQDTGVVSITRVLFALAALDDARRRCNRSRLCIILRQRARMGSRRPQMSA